MTPKKKKKNPKYLKWEEKKKNPKNTKMTKIALETSKMTEVTLNLSND